MRKHTLDNLPRMDVIDNIKVNLTPEMIDIVYQLFADRDALDLWEMVKP